MRIYSIHGNFWIIPIKADFTHLRVIKKPLVIMWSMGIWEVTIWPKNGWDCWNKGQNSHFWTNLMPYFKIWRLPSNFDFIDASPQWVDRHIYYIKFKVRRQIYFLVTVDLFSLSYYESFHADVKLDHKCHYLDSGWPMCNLKLGIAPELDPDTHGIGHIWWFYHLPIAVKFSHLLIS